MLSKFRWKKQKILEGQVSVIDLWFFGFSSVSVSVEFRSEKNFTLRNECYTLEINPYINPHILYTQ